jgi:hypothetical protein
MGRQRETPEESDTNRVERLVVLWLDLERAWQSACKGNGRCPPWECEDKRVHQVWEQITRPENSRVLEHWLSQTACRRTELWAQQALLECRRRCKEEA